MIAGLAVFAVALLLRSIAVNSRIRSRLLVSAFVGAAAAAMTAAMASGLTTLAMVEYERPAAFLALAFALINGAVALAMNPWREEGHHPRYPAIVQDATALSLVSVVAVVALQDQSAALTTGAAVVVGLALKDTLGNLVAGLAIQVEKPFSVGQWVQVAGVDGQVKEVTWRATKIETRTGDFVVVPNGKLADDIITNYSDPTPDTRVDIDVSVPRDVAPNTAKDVMRTAISGIPSLAHSRPPEILLNDFAASTLTYRVRLWTADFAAVDHLGDQARQAISYAFRRHRIRPPYNFELKFIRSGAVSPDIDLATLERTLRATSLFERVDTETLQQIARTATLATYGRDEMVVRYGDHDLSLYVVVAGSVSVLLPPDDIAVAQIGLSGFFGEMSLLTGAARSASVRAVGDVTLLEISPDAFRAVAERDPRVIEQVAVVAAARQSELDARKSERDRSRPTAEPTGTFVARVKRFLRSRGSR